MRIKRVIKILIVFIIFSVILSGYTVFAEEINSETQPFQKEKERLLSDLPEESKEIIEDFTNDGVLSVSPNELIKNIFSNIINNSKAPFNALISVVATLIISSLAEGFKGNSLKPVSEVYGYIVTLVISASVVIPIINLIDSMAYAISQAGNFMKLFIPVFAGVMLAGGQSVTADGYQLVALSASEFVSLIAENFILPVLSIFLAMSIMASNSAEGFDLSKLTKTLKGIVTTVLTFITTLYCGLLSVQGIIGNTADTYATKTAKFVISSSVPAIGNALSDALTSVQSGIKTMRGSLGVVGILAPVILLLPSILNVFMWQLCIKIAEMLSGFMRQEKAEKLLTAVSSVIGLLISVSLLLAALLIVTTTIIMMIGGNQ